MFFSGSCVGTGLVVFDTAFSSFDLPGHFVDPNFLIWGSFPDDCHAHHDTVETYILPPSDAADEIRASSPMSG